MKEFYPHGFFQITAASPEVAVANTSHNARAAVDAINASSADLVLLPELYLTGYSCGDLFHSEALPRSALSALQDIISHSKTHRAIVVLGLPLVVNGALMNVAAIVSGGKLHGLVPKSYLPNYREFYEARHFRAASQNDPETIRVFDEPVPFGTDLLFHCGEAVIAIEICEDLWLPRQPSSDAALAGANVLLNLSGSNETIGKASWRQDLVKSQSGRCIAAYAYASSGATESTSDLVFSGHCAIAENGVILGESRRIGDGLLPVYLTQSAVTCDVDLQKLAHDRQVMGSFHDARSAVHKDFRNIDIAAGKTPVKKPGAELARAVSAHPFVPEAAHELAARCAEILAIQVSGLCKRMSRLPGDTRYAIGVSGGLDSTLALLVAIQACDAMGLSRKRILGMTMPGFGTTTRTRDNADRLLAATGVSTECVDIRQLCLDTFRSLGHQPLGIEIEDSTTVETLQKQLVKSTGKPSDLTFENVQARMRTLLLMSRGFVLGTGDMSEQALGWSTYNADHMSMYNVNTSIPKTLVRFLVRYFAEHHFEGDTAKLLNDISETPVSPELMPPAADGSIRQKTEEQIGDYELHDFFLFHFVRNGFQREKILYLASKAQFDKAYSEEFIARTWDTFIRRFFASQYKRNCVPDGPKVGSVSLSPRGDWRMPSDADPDSFI